MEVIFNIKYQKGDRVWMPDGKGGFEKGRVVSAILYGADLYEPDKSVVTSLNYHCVNEDGKECIFHENSLRSR